MKGELVLDGCSYNVDRVLMWVLPPVASSGLPLLLGVVNCEIEVVVLKDFSSGRYDFRPGSVPM